MNLLKRLCLFILVATVTLSLHAIAIPHPLDVPAMLKRAATATAKSFPEANLVLVDDTIHSTYQADGTYVTYDDMAYKILTAKGRDQMKTLSTYYTASYGKSTILLLEIYKTDGTVVRPPLAKLLKEMSDPGQMSSNIYDPNQKIITANVPGLQVGDTIRYCVRREVFKPRCPQTYSDIFVLESSEPIVNYDILIDGPQALPLKKIAVRDPVGKTVTSSQTKTPDGRIHYRWKIQNVPVMIPEPKMPKAYMVSQRLLVSTIDSWEDVSTWYWNLCQPRMKTTPEMTAKVQELTRGLKTQKEKIRSIFKFVSQEVRYVGITMEDDAPGYEPHDVAITFKNRHGVCRDKAALLAAMLRLADIKAFPVLIMAGEKIDQEVCQPFFNHAITAALGEDGNYILMDSTDENTRDIFPPYLADKSYLVARKEGETLQTSPFSPAKDNRISIQTKGTIDAKGTLDAATTIRFTGYNDNAYRGFFANSSQEDIKDFMHRAVNAVAPGASITDLIVKPDNMLDTNVPLSITLHLNAKSLFTDNEQVAMVMPPFLSRVMGMQALVLSSTHLDTRKYPYKTGVAAEASENVSLTIHPAWGAPKAMPNVAQIDDGIMTWKRQATFKNRTLAIQNTNSVNQLQYSPQEYLTLKQHLKTIHDNNRKQFIFFKQQNSGTPMIQGLDAEIIAQDTAYNLTDANTWTSTKSVTAKILSYKGKKENSELLLAFNPAYQKLHVDLARVTTTSKDAKGKPVTSTQDINRKDIRIMDQSWVAGAPRYPAAKICVVPLPGVEVGSVIQYKITTTTNGLPFFHLRESFRQVGISIRHQSITVNTPAQLKLSTAVFQSGILANGFNTHQNNIAETFVTENNRTIWTWSASNQQAVPEEPQQAPVMTFAPTVLCSTYPWSEYIGILTQNLKSKVVAGNRIGQLMADLKKQVPQPGRQQLQELNRRLNLLVRAAGPSYLSLPLTTLSNAETTLTDGYGHNADRAILAYTILQKLGYKPSFVFATAGEQPQAIFRQLHAVPSPALFSKLLVKVTTQNETFWFNDQNQYADIRTTTADNRFALTENAKLCILKTEQAYHTDSVADCHITVDDNGDAALVESTVVNGTAYGSQNKFFSELNPEPRKRLHLSLVRAFSPRAEITGPLTADFKTYPGTLAYACKIPRFATKDGDYLYFSLPIQDYRKLALNIDDKRETPLARTSTKRLTRRFVIKLPPTYAKLAMFPQNYQWQAPDGTATYSLNAEQTTPGTLKVTYKAAIKPTIVTPESFLAYRKLHNVIAHPKFSTILLTK